MRRILPVLLLGAATLAASPRIAASPQADARALEAILASMHPDHVRYIRAVRPARAGLAPGELYLGLVRPGGEDPRRHGDAPRSGAGRRSDLIVFPGAVPPRGPSPWTRLLVDHEYFHARHLARGDRLPHPTFDSTAANRHFHEALAWGYNLRRARDGAYGTLPARRIAEIEARYREHRGAFRRYVLSQPGAAWAYYRGFLPEAAD